MKITAIFTMIVYLCVGPEPGMLVLLLPGHYVERKRSLAEMVVTDRLWIQHA